MSRDLCVLEHNSLLLYGAPYYRWVEYVNLGYVTEVPRNGEDNDC
jgi:hypothetical protein